MIFEEAEKLAGKYGVIVLPWSQCRHLATTLMQMLPFQHPFHVGQRWRLRPMRQRHLLVGLQTQSPLSLFLLLWIRALRLLCQWAVHPAFGCNKASHGQWHRLITVAQLLLDLLFYCYIGSFVKSAHNDTSYKWLHGIKLEMSEIHTEAVIKFSRKGLEQCTVTSSGWSDDFK